MEFMRPYLIRLSTDVFDRIVQVKGEGWEKRINKKRLAAMVQIKADNERRALPGSSAKQRLRESRPKDSMAVEQPDGTWLVYELDDGRQVLYRSEDCSYILVATDAGRTAFENVASLMRQLNSEAQD